MKVKDVKEMTVEEMSEEVEKGRKALAAIARLIWAEGEAKEDIQSSYEEAIWGKRRGERLSSEHGE